MSGGHNVLNAFFASGKSPLDIKNIFISHWDSDHILGIVPLVRAFKSDPEKRHRRVYCSQDVMSAIEGIFSHTAHHHYQVAKKNGLLFDIVADGDSRVVDGWSVSFFDVRGSKTPQLGCAVTLPEGKKIAYLGDEPLSVSALPYVEASDILLHEAFCTSKTVDSFKPYEKHHGTACDAGLNGIKAKARTLVLLHMEDQTLSTRKQRYGEDVQASGYAGNIFVPVDLDVLTFKS